ncbi:hypothetical protein ACFL6F_01885 [Planctomycetota bacterium]
MKLSWISVCAILVLLGLAVLIQYHFDKPGFKQLEKGMKLKYHKVDEGVHLLPSPLALQSLSAGFNSILSEFLMLKSLNYFYQYKYSGRDSGYQARIYSCVTALNPYYFTAYRYGGYFLNGPFRMKTDALRSFKKGVASLARKDMQLSPAWMNPPPSKQDALIRKEYIPSEQAVKLMLETAIHYFAYLKNNTKGAEICRYGQRVFPQYTKYFMEKEIILRSEAGQNQLVMKIWERFVEANKHDANKMALGILMIKKYSSLYGIEMLSKRISADHQRTGSYPASLLAIAEPGECIDGFGDIYMYVRKTGKIHSRMVEEENIDAKKNLYIRKVKQWYKSNGSYPASLEEIEIGTNDYIHIPFEVNYRYNSDTGGVEPPLGFGNDICRLILKLVSAEYIYAHETKAFLAGGDISALLEILPDEEAKSEIDAFLKVFSSYSIGFIPGVKPFALYALSPEEGMYIVRESGPVYFNSGMKTIAAWPENISVWKAVTP